MDQFFQDNVKEVELIKAKQLKVLNHDLMLFVNVCASGVSEYAKQMLSMIKEYIMTSIDQKLFAELSPIKQKMYYLVLKQDIEGLIRFKKSIPMVKLKEINSDDDRVNLSLRITGTEEEVTFQKIAVFLCGEENQRVKAKTIDHIGENDYNVQFKLKRRTKYNEDYRVLIAYQNQYDAGTLFLQENIYDFDGIHIHVKITPLKKHIKNSIKKLLN